MSGTKRTFGALGVVVFILCAAVTLWLPFYYPDATAIVPQVVSCVPQKTDPQSSGNWQPTLSVKVEPVRDPGWVREYRVLGCTLYYYHAHFR